MGKLEIASLSACNIPSFYIPEFFFWHLSRKIIFWFFLNIFKFKNLPFNHSSLRGQTVFFTKILGNESEYL